MGKGALLSPNAGELDALAGARGVFAGESAPVELGMHACDRAGVNARSVADVKLFNDIFSECGRGYSTLAAEGLRVGFPRNFWEDIGEEAGSLPR